MDEPKPTLVGRIEVNEGGKVVVVHTVAGDLVLNSDAIAHAARKQWRELSWTSFLSTNLETDMRLTCPRHWVVALRDTFRDAGFTSFTMVVSVQSERSVERLGQTLTFSPIDVVSHKAEFVGAMKALIRGSLDPETENRRKHVDAANTTLAELKGWDVSVQTHKGIDTVPYSCEYNPDMRTIKIHPHETLSTDPNDYPQKLSLTSELLALLATLIHSEVVILNAPLSALDAYPVAKLFLDVIDNKTCDYNQVRVNVEDDEEWDYLNPAVDDELKGLRDSWKAG